ncbi:ATP-binding cassette sub-family D member 4-like isoform X1 [Mizuhopecten yessoensis]|uniref:ATP-binding cassette sub-family D member 4-like isoform X1 n=1 Tax=Mizuhopecten yessoensis TaxID=6573 RepID=UPI000B45DE51|nr:ATP-binding cassette sub-family D member 4-like isoform X1 [Mizuhopecten yessoensis]
MVDVNKQTRHSRLKFDYKFLKRFLRLLGWMFPSLCSKQSILFLFLLCLGLLEQVVVFNIGYVPSKYYEVFGNKDYEGFVHETFLALLLIISESLIKSTITFVGSILYILLRGLLTKRIHQKYFKDYLYYKINVLSSTDNPDQRITQDVERLCFYFSEILSPLVISPFTIGYYIYQCIQKTGYLGPVGVLGFFLVGTVFNKLLMSPVVDYVFRREKMEGNFRFKHMQMRVNAESAAFYKAGAIERNKTDTHLDNLLTVQKKLVIRKYFLNMSINLSDYLGSILSYLLLALPIFKGSYDNLSASDLAALISQNSFVIIYLINCFTKLIDMSVQVSEMAGNAHRVGELMEALGTLRAEDDTVYNFLDPSNDGDAAISLSDISNVPSNRGEDEASVGSVQMSERALTIQDLTYGPPNSHVILCRNLSFQLESGVNTLIKGDSGCGKSSLLRVMSGLWPTVTGSVTKHIPMVHKKILFLPQKPYFTDGSLREQVMYPVQDILSGSVSAENQKIFQYLEYVGLKDIIDRVIDLDRDMDWNWYDELSPGEMQRLSFVRLFYHQPKFAVLDEATSQIGLVAEEKMYEMCGQLGITVLSVGHRHSLDKYHTIEIILDGQGGWKIQPITDNLISASTC